MGHRQITSRAAKTTTVVCLILLAITSAKADQAIPSPPPSPTSARPISANDVTARYRQDTSGAYRANACSSTLRISSYALQAADSISAGAAVRRGAIGKTPFGTASTGTYLASTAALDAVIGAFTRRAACATKHLIETALGASALNNLIYDQRIK